jgi:hypothetical protein
MTLKFGAACVKATSPSSTAHPHLVGTTGRQPTKDGNTACFLMPFGDGKPIRKPTNPAFTLVSRHAPQKSNAQDLAGRAREARPPRPSGPSLGRQSHRRKKLGRPVASRPSFSRRCAASSGDDRLRRSLRIRAFRAADSQTLMVRRRGAPSRTMRPRSRPPETLCDRPASRRSQWPGWTFFSASYCAGVASRWYFAFHSS